MSPSGFQPCLVRRYERYLSGTQPLSEQDGSLQEAQWEAELFDAAFPGSPHIVSNPRDLPPFTWRLLNVTICAYVNNTRVADVIAPEFEDTATGEITIVITLPNEMQFKTPLSFINTPIHISPGEVTAKE